VRADRLVSLVLLLQAGGRVTARRLAAELGVSVRTVYRDLAALSAAGVPVFTEPGPGGGCQLVDGYRFGLRGLRPEEAEALLVLLEYRAHDAAAPRTVAPLGLVNKAGTWYLVAMTGGGQVLVFRAGRITRAKVSSASFAHPAGFDLARFWQEWSREFAASRPRLPVRLRVSPHALAALPEVFGEEVHSAIGAATAAGDDGWRELTLSFEHELAAAHRLAGFGGQLEVLAPAAVRDRLVAAAQGILSRYTAGRAATCHPEGSSTSSPPVADSAPGHPNSSSTSSPTP
jgi:predicted DNA-binding transcriptional regulator YafY